MGAKYEKVLIIGGGVIGLATARAIARKGDCKVTLVERGFLAREASFAAAGMLSPDVDCDELDDFYLACRESNRMFDALAEELLDETGIDICLQRDGALAIAANDEDARPIIEKAKRQVLLGVTAEVISPRDACKLEPALSPTISAAAFYPEDGQVDNREFASALIRSALNFGVEIRENTAVTSVETKGGRVSGVRAGGRVIDADAVIVAAGPWSDFLLKSANVSGFGVRPIRGQIMTCFASERRLRRIVVGRRFYAVPRVDGRLLIGATSEDVGFCKQVLPESIENMRQAAIETLPWLKNVELREAIAGLRPLADRSRPVIGEIPSVKDLFVATGHYRNGILLAPWTAETLANSILDLGHPTHGNPFEPAMIASAFAN